MKIDFSSKKISLVLVSYDLRAGFNSLYKTAMDYLGIDVMKQQDWVIFISKSREFAKIIGADDKGSILICRKLNHGRFQQLMGAISGPAARVLSTQELERYLDGECLEVKRKSLLYG